MIKCEHCGNEFEDTMETNGVCPKCKYKAEAFKVTEITKTFGAHVKCICDEVADMLIEKNTKYGNSALDPKRIFSSSDTVEQLNVRIDDKLSRIANQNESDDEDAELDLIGYLILKRIAKEQENG